jgi:tRNA-dihydrouridine synthase B
MPNTRVKQICAADGGAQADGARAGGRRRGAGRRGTRTPAAGAGKRNSARHAEPCARTGALAGSGYAATVRRLTDSWFLGGLEIRNRVVLAPLAGIGKWFVRLQAKRFGAGLAVSEMVSSFGLVHGNPRTVREFLRIHPDEHPVSIQLFGHDPAVMREAAAMVAAAGADVIDLNMGCPVRKVCRTGAGAALLADPERAVEIARAAGKGGGLPVTVKLRPGHEPGQRNGLDLARRLVDEAGVAAIAFHPRHASQQHSGRPDHALARDLVQSLPVPLLVSGGLSSDERALRAFEDTGAEAVMLARGSLGNPWRFGRLLGLYDGEPSPAEVAEELRWVIGRAEEHLGVERAGRYLRKFYPWYADRLGLTKGERVPLVTAPTTVHAREALAQIAGRERLVAA